MTPAPFRRGPLNRLRHHVDRAAWALGGAQAAAFAIVVIELEALARTELDDGVVGADAVAIVAFEAIAATQAAARFVERVGGVEAAHDLLEILDTARGLDQRANGRRRVLVIPGVEAVETRGSVLWRGLTRDAAQKGVDMARRLLGVADGDRDGALGGR